jgi:hypothetical protein
MTITLDFHFFFALAALAASLLAIWLNSQTEKRLESEKRVLDWLETWARSERGECPPPPPLDTDPGSNMRGRR